ncbi:MAG: OmpA family protein [Flavobacteriaceae bacterium]
MKLVYTFILLSIINLNAQNKINLHNEIGVFVGNSFMQTDYGEAKSFKSASNNTGINFGLAYIADFSESKFDSKLFRFFSSHSKTRLELSYTKVDFEYDGKPVSNTHSQYQNFSAMKGSSKLINFGIIGEFYLRSIKKHKKFQPYLISGISFSSVKPELVSNLPLPTIYMPTIENVFLEQQRVLSFTYGFGSRYRIKNIDLLFEGRFNPFLSDKIEGLDSNISGDKHNDSQVIFNFGLVYHFKAKQETVKDKELIKEIPKILPTPKKIVRKPSVNKKPRIKKNIDTNKNHSSNDYDEDGYRNDVDKCPLLFSKTNNGCPNDKDKDGIIDSLDKCPNTFGIKSNNGCPKVYEKRKRKYKETVFKTKNDQDWISEKIFFDLNSSDLNKQSKFDLSVIAYYMLDNPEAEFLLKGFTDSGGHDDYNLVLSEQRCIAVKDYLISRGVKAGNIETIGYGEVHSKYKDSPINRKNRRVEIILKD